MTVKEMRQALKGLPPNMQIVMPHGIDSFITVCNEKVEIIRAEVDGEYHNLILLNPCTCTEDANNLTDIINLN